MQECHLCIWVCTGLHLWRALSAKPDTEPVELFKPGNSMTASDLGVELASKLREKLGKGQLATLGQENFDFQRKSPKIHPGKGILEFSQYPSHSPYLPQAPARVA